MSSSLAKDQLSKVFVGRHDNSFATSRYLQNFVVRDARTHLCYIRDVMTRVSKGFNDRSVHPLVAEKLQRASLGMG